LGEVYNTTEMKMDRNSRVFIDFISFELKVPTICLVIKGVSVRRDRRYIISIILYVLLKDTVLKVAPRKNKFRSY
jgi:hypothetical protein